MVTVTSEPIDVGQILEFLRAPEAGGVDVFMGVVRNHAGGRKVLRLEYSAYVPMAEKMMKEIEREIRERWPVHRLVLVHRIGKLEIGDVAVVTAVSTSHRNDAFEACRHAIDQIKECVPIWKKEFFEDGESWVKPGIEVVPQGNQ